MYIAVERNITDPVVTEIRLINLSEVCARGILWQTDDGRNVYTFLIKISGAERGSIKDSLLEVTFIEEQLEQVEPNVFSNTIPEARDIQKLYKNTNDNWIRVVSSIKDNVIKVEKLAYLVARELADLKNQRQEILHVYSVKTLDTDIKSLD